VAVLLVAVVVWVVKVLVVDSSHAAVAALPVVDEVPPRRHELMKIAHASLHLLTSFSNFLPRLAVTDSIS
jgi:hypothetical protein